MKASVVSLDELVSNNAIQLTRGKVISKRDIEMEPGPFPIYSSARENDGKFGEYGRYMFDEELVTWSVDGGGNLFYRTRHKFSVTNVGGILRVLRKDVIDCKYLYRALSYKHSRLKFDWVQKAHPSVIRRLYTDIYLPSIKEQQRIAAILDSADALRAKRHHALDKLDTIAQSIFTDMFGNPGASKYPSVQLEDLARKPITRGIDQPGPHVDGGVPYLKTTDFGKPNLVKANLARSAHEIAGRFPKSFVDVGDTIICIRATVGPTLFVNSELANANLSRGTALVSPNNQVLPEYLFQALSSAPFQLQIRRKLRGATFLQIPLGELRRLKVIIPPLDEQAIFVKRINLASSLMERGRYQATLIDSLFSSLQQRAFRGEL